MIAIEEIRRSLRGAWALAAGREDWRENFDFSADGFFKSFWAMPLGLPLTLFSTAVFSTVVQNLLMQSDSAAAREAAANAPSLSKSLAIAGVSYFVEWALALFIMVAVARFLQVSQNIAILINAYNWTRLLILLVSAVPSALYAVGLRSELLFIMLLTAIGMWSLIVLWRTIRRGLDIAPGQATAMMLLVVLASVLFNFGAGSLLDG